MPTTSGKSREEATRLSEKAKHSTVCAQLRRQLRKWQLRSGGSESLSGGSESLQERTEALLHVVEVRLAHELPNDLAHAEMHSLVLFKLSHAFRTASTRRHMQPASEYRYRRAVDVMPARCCGATPLPIIPKHHHPRLSLCWHGEQRARPGYDAMPLTAAHTDCRAGWSCSITLTRATLFAGTPLRSSIVWPEPPDPPHTSEVVWSAPRFGVQLWLLSPSDGCELPGAPGQWFCAVSCGTVIQWSDRIQDAPYRGLRLFQIPHLQARTPVLPNDSGTNSVSCCLLCFVVQDKKQAHEQNLNLHRHVHDSRSTCTCIDIDTPTSIPTSRKY